MGKQKRETGKVTEMSEKFVLHQKKPLKNPDAGQIARIHIRSLSDCGLPIPGRRFRQETDISFMTCIGMISR